MLKEFDFAWVGKLPVNADFIQSKHHIELEQAFMNWMIEGQDHLGERMFRQVNAQRYVYYFTLNNMPKTLHGFMFLSEDQRHRQCPFVLFSEKEASALEMLQHLKTCFEQLHFDIGLLISNLNNDQLFEDIESKLRNINELVTKSKAQQWIEVYPNLADFNLSVEILSPILYRKLVHRQV